MFALSGCKYEIYHLHIDGLRSCAGRHLPTSSIAQWKTRHPERMNPTDVSETPAGTFGQKSGAWENGRPNAEQTG